jgi:hypothetical protein
MPKHTYKVNFHTREQLKEYIHSIHDYIRNSGAGYGMDALKIFNVFYSLKIIEGKTSELGLSHFCDWGYMRQQYIKYRNNTHDMDFNIYNAVNELRNLYLNDNDGRHPLFEFITNIYDDVGNISDTLDDKKTKNIQLKLEALRDKLGNKIDDIRDRNRNKDLKNVAYFIYYQIPNGLPRDFCADLFEKIDNLPISKEDNSSFDVRGKIYEYFIGRDKQAISDLGAYFTDRYITNFCVSKCEIDIDNNKIPTCCDIFGGSGGFTLQYVDYINNNYPNILWKDNYQRIKHFDMAENVIKVAGVEFYSQTGFFPKMDEQFKRVNSFKYEFKEKFNIVISNPPYGGDKNNKSPEIQRLENIIDENNKIINDILNNLVDNKKFKTDISKLNKKINEFIDYNIINKFTNLINENDLPKFYKLVEEITNDFCKTTKINYNDNKNDLIKIVRLSWQIIVLKNMIKKEMDETYKQKVNYDTCSKFIRDYAKIITEYYETKTKELYINEINKLLLNETEENKIDNLKKTLKSLEKELKTYKLFEKDIKFNDKEACSWLLLMNLLEDDGICIAVLKEGVFFDEVYSDIRLFLINNFNVTDIWSIDSKAFENTTTKTSIIKFKKTGKTSKIIFYDLQVNKYNETKYNYDDNYGTDITQYKERISSIEEKYICSASYKQLMEIKTTWNKNNEPKFNIPCSFNMKDYKDYKVVCPEGYEIKKLGEYLSYDKKSKRNASYASENGKYRFYTSSDKIKKCDECDFNDNELKLIIGTGGTGSLFIDNKFSCSADNFVCSTKYKYELLYIYDYIKLNWNDFIDRMFNGSTLGHINKDKLNNCEIPFPKDINKIKPQLEELYKLHQNIMMNTEDIPIKEKNICDIIKKATEEGKKGVDYDEYKLGDVNVFKIVYGTRITKNNNIEGLIPVYGGGDITFYTNKSNLSGKNILISRFGNCIKEKCTKIIYGDIFLNDSGFTVKSNNKIISNDLLIYILKVYNNEIYDCKRGSAQLNMNMDDIKKLNIKIPTEKQMKKHKIQELFDEVDKIKEQLEQDKLTYQNKMKELFKDFEENKTNDNINNYSEQSQINKFKLRNLIIPKDNYTDDELLSDKEESEEIINKQKIKTKKLSNNSDDINDGNISNIEKKIKKKVKSK